MSFQAEKCCHLVSEHEVSAVWLCSSVRQFLIYSTFVLVTVRLLHRRQRSCLRRKVEAVQKRESLMLICWLRVCFSSASVLLKFCHCCQESFFCRSSFTHAFNYCRFLNVCSMALSLFIIVTYLIIIMVLSLWHGHCQCSPSLYDKCRTMPQCVSATWCQPLDQI